MRFKFFSITIFAVLLISLVLPQLVLARGLVPCGGTGEPKCNICHFFQLLQKIISGASVTLLALAAIFIVIGGMVILSSVGSPDKISQGKKMITYSIIGIVICFGAWIIINTVMSALVNPGKMPWPWNKIQCIPTRDEGETHKECVNSVCTNVSGAGTNQCSISTDCGGGETGDKKYCVCETPVYDLDPDKDSNASLIATNAKVTSTLSSQTECLQKCVAANAATYCKTSLKPQTAIYCASEAGLKNKNACTLYLKTTSVNCQIATTCFNSENECLNAAKTTYKKRCYLDGVSLCKCYTGSQKATCGSSATKYVLYRIKEEYSPGGASLWDCNNASPYYCRLNCQYDKCQQIVTNTCDQLNPPLGQTASCFGGKFTCQQGIIDQENEACGELKSLLDCMANKDLPAAAKEISSIADNSPPVAGSLPGCFQSWTSQCSGSTDSCTGTCCGHSQCSLHYGGKARTDFGPSACGIGSVDCRSCSWAADFANESYFNQIKTAAENCSEELWDGNLEKVDVIHEGNHVHVELEGIAKYHKCK